MGKVFSTGSGRPALSDEAIQYKIGRKRTVRYRYEPLKSRGKTIGHRAVVVGPFHSNLYGQSACGYGTNSRRSAKEALAHRLAREFSYIGQMQYSDVDTADTVALGVDSRTTEDVANRPITNSCAVGAAGQ